MNPEDVEGTNRYLPRLLGAERAENRVLVYAPTLDIAFEVDILAWNFLRKASGKPLSSLPPLREDEKRLLTVLAAKGVVEEHNQKTGAHIPQFQPTTLILLPTARCNLHCAYCFSSGGDTSASFQTEVGTAAIDFVLSRITAAGGKNFHLKYLGGGEPTLAWDVLKETWLYAAGRCANLGIRLRSSITTNTTWDKRTGNWLKRHFDIITVSMDGTRDIMRLHRPAANGKNMYDTIVANIKALSNNGCRIEIRSTVSKASMHDVLPALDLFMSLGVRNIHFEPLSQIGRATATGIEAPPMDEFFEIFWQAYIMGKAKGVRVTSSFAKGIQDNSWYCRAPEKIVCVTPLGRLTACHRSADNTGDIGGRFHYGYYDSTTQCICFQEERLQTLLHDITPVNPECEHCIASVHCTGGCYFKNLNFSGTLNGINTKWCKLARESVCRLIELSLDG